MTLDTECCYSACIDISETLTDEWDVLTALFARLVLLVGAEKMPWEMVTLVAGT